jgi:hypothetical protein
VKAGGGRQWGSGLASGKRQKRKMNGLLGCFSANARGSKGPGVLR